MQILIFCLTKRDGEYRRKEGHGSEGGHGGLLVFGRRRPRAEERAGHSPAPILLEIQPPAVVSWLRLLLLWKLLSNPPRMPSLENSGTILV
ncbi:hypothetical protein CFP56_004772 [Quercus suber]|uniref:Uncharacterized protein n=1 Tax=Quercus suber TaxID=58331 RepID=A0AAW0M786_QUESU